VTIFGWLNEWTKLNGKMPAEREFFGRKKVGGCQYKKYYINKQIQFGT
jgi:hypothetical protein